MILKRADKVLLAHRRLFADDQPRFFVGTVGDYIDGVAKVTGHSWLRDPVRGDVLQKGDCRTKIVSLSSGTLLVYQLPDATQLDELRIERGERQEVFLTDGASLRLDLTDHH